MSHVDLKVQLLKFRKIFYKKRFTEGNIMSPEVFSLLHCFGDYDKNISFGTLAIHNQQTKSWFLSNFNKQKPLSQWLNYDNDSLDPVKQKNIQIRNQ